MWYLISLENPDVKYTLLVGKVYVIGRKNCDILLLGDAAVSRKHAEIELVHPQINISNTDKLPTVTLTDVSKFGTTVNGEKIQKTELHDSDMIVFGNNSNFTLVYEPFIISSSCLDQPSKKKVRELICVLGGHIVNDWKKDCSLLVMSNISVTIKVVCALLSLKNIVTPEYLHYYVKYLKGENEKPDPNEYLPIITETQVDSNDVSFKVVPERKTIFQGMKFIFLNEKQFKKMHVAIELGGGLPVLLEEKSQNDKILVEKGAVVMYCEPNTQMLSQDSHDWILHVQSYLYRHKKHMIQDSEIGYAVLYCSTEKHCNPDTDVGSHIVGHVSSQSVSNTDVLVPNTEVSPNRSPTKRKKKKCETVLDETKLEKQENVKQTNEKKMKQETNLSHDQTITSTEQGGPPTSKKSQDQTVSSTEQGRQHTSKSSVKRSRMEEEEEITEITPLKKKVKQEAVTPLKTENESRNVRSRRSPSPAPKTSPKRQNKILSVQTEVGSPSNPSTMASQWHEKCKEEVKVKREIEISDEELDNKPTLIVDDSDDELLDKTSQKKETLSTPRSKSKLLADEDLENQGKRRGGKGDTKETSKHKILVEDSDEDNNMQQKRYNKKGRDNSDDEFDRLKTKKKGVDNSDNEFDRLKTKKKGVDNSDDEFDKLKTKKKGEDNSDDEFDRLTMRKKPRTEHDNTVSDYSKNINVNSVSSLSREKDEENRTSIKKEKEDNAPPLGFVSSQRIGQDNEIKSSDNRIEENLPSKCIVIKFVELVARKPTKSTNPSNEGIPEGFIRWKGKLVRNFKKFRKTEHAGANRLPRIIGGSDLVPHNASNRKDLDDWFKEAVHAESQQTETDRKAKELFDWEPGIKKKAR